MSEEAPPIHPAPIQTCPQCYRKYVPDLALLPDWPEKYERWKGGAYIKDVWPDSFPYQREQLISGVCSDEHWDELFKEEDDD